MTKRSQPHPHSGNCSISVAPECHCPCNGRMHGAKRRRIRSVGRGVDHDVVADAVKLLRKLGRRAA